jgi:hypothetical protein
MVILMVSDDFDWTGTNLDKLESHFRGDIHTFRIMIPRLLMPSLDGQ